MGLGIISNFVPPLILRFAHKYFGSVTWRGNYPDWKSAAAASSGYDDESIFRRVLESARRVRDGQAVWERDSVCFYHEKYNWPLLACLMTAATESDGRLHVLDYGGALGSTYMQHRKILKTLRECTWNIIEQPHIVAAGKKEFTSNVVSFYQSVDDCLSSHSVNVVLFSSVLQYLENCYDVITDICNRNMIDYIIIDRTPFIEHDERLTVQHVSSKIYKATYPCRFLNKEHVTSILKNNYMLTPWFESQEDPAGFYGVMAIRLR